MVVNLAVDRVQLTLKTWHTLVDSNVTGKPKRVWDSKRHGILTRKPDNPKLPGLNGLIPRCAVNYQTSAAPIAR
jgi:hypothetical protein